MSTENVEAVVVDDVKKPVVDKKALRKAAREAQSSQARGAADEDIEQYKDQFATLPMHQSTQRTDRQFVRLKDLNSSHSGKKVWIRARVQSTRGKGNVCFLILRQQFMTIQAVVEKSDDVPKAMVKFASKVNKESIVDFEALVKTLETPTKSTTVKDYELAVQKLFVVSPAVPELPFQLEDAARPEAFYDEVARQLEGLERSIAEAEAALVQHPGDEALLKTLEELKKSKSSASMYVRVGLDTRLDNRVLDLRTVTNQAIFRVQSAVGTLFREFLLKHDFVEIHTPKILGGTSEGGSEVFRLKYFDRPACLAQSPQLYKQMGVVCDLERVFEIGPVFRAENSQTHRHMTEFIGLDMEMAFYDHYHEVLDMLENLFCYMFEQLESRFSTEVELIREQFPCPAFVFKPTRLTYPEGMAMLRADGVQVADYADMSTENEKHLGRLVREKYGSDFFILDKFPSAIRPFYTMWDATDERYSNSYDLFMRGEEIMSGAQRLHEPELLAQRAQAKGIDPDSIRWYIDGMKYGAPPHAGGGVGLERVVMLYLGLGNIRRSSMFPRDPKRLSP